MDCEYCIKGLSFGLISLSRSFLKTEYGEICLAISFILEKLNRWKGNNKHKLAILVLTAFCDFYRLHIMFVLKQPHPQHLFSIIMKKSAQNGQAFEQILGKKQMFFFKSQLSLFLLCEYICQVNIGNILFFEKNTISNLKTIKQDYNYILYMQSVRAFERNSVVVGSNPNQANFLQLLLKILQW